MKLEEPIQNKKNHKSEEDLDLTQVISKIFQGLLVAFKYIFRFFFLLADNIFIRIKLVIVFTLFGILLGAGFYFSYKPYFESSMTLTSNYFKGELLDNSINNLNAVMEEGNYKVLASLLKIPEADAKKFRGIKISPLMSQNIKMLIEFYLQDEKKYGGKLDSLLLYDNQGTFQLKVETFDTAVFRGLDSTLINYIRQNEYVKKRIEVDRANLLSLKNKLIKESGSLDTLKRNIAASIRSSGDAGRTGTNNVILGEKTVNPIEIYEQDLDLYNERQKIERQLALNAEIEIIERFIPFAEPKTGSLKTNLLKGAFAGFILSILYILYILLREALTRLRYSLEENDVS